MGDFLRRLRLPLFFAALLLTTLVLMLGDRRAQQQSAERSWLANALLEISVPIQKAIDWPARRLRAAWGHYADLVDVREENQRLEKRLRDLEEDKLQLEEALVASGHLERIARMRKDFEVPLLPTEVVGQDVSPWFRSLLLDRGNRDQVRTGMPVVSGRGLVGVIAATTPHASRAMLLLDRRSRVDAIIQRSRARGIVRGAGSGSLEFVFMVRGDDVETGDVVITSGVGGVYPRGLRVGVVTQVRKGDSDLLHTATVHPAVDFGRLEQVFVMQERGPTMDLLYGGEGDLAGPVPKAQRP